MDHDQSSASQIDVTTEPYIGRWNRLISTTNWEKGRIIHEWRAELQSAGVPTTEYSDESWSRIVGSVSGQHVGRLRRVYERFGDVFLEYEGLFWSHFQAALDWDDAEMWLEGSLQNDWSVSKMRKQRWETLGSVQEDQPGEKEIVDADLDEDFQAGDDSGDSDSRSDRDIVVNADEFVAEARSPAGPDFGDAEDVPRGSRPAAGTESGASIFAESEPQAVPFVRPFENLAELPDDVADAFDAFKLAILRHKANSWQEISRDDLLASLDALKEFVLAPVVDEA